VKLHQQSFRRGSCFSGMNGLPHYRCGRTRLGVLSADVQQAFWQQCDVLEFRDALTGSWPKQQTSVRCAWDEHEWRLLFHCEDAMPWATFTERDAPLFQEETVEVFFDPVGDLESYYEVEVNPLGTILDIVFRKSRSGYKGDWAWNCEGIDALARMVDGGWAAELSLPFASIAAVPLIGAQWRVNFCRIDRPSRDGSIPRELSAWSAPLRENFHTPERFGIVEFV
jgi:Carbohydrate family 9 binding domain-like